MARAVATSAVQTAVMSAGVSVEDYLDIAAYGFRPEVTRTVGLFPAALDLHLTVRLPAIKLLATT